VEQRCTPGHRVCQDNAVFICSADGLELVLSEECHESAACTDDSLMGGFAYCKSSPCTPGQKLCQGNVVKECTDDGMIAEDGTDCGDDLCDRGECKPRLCELFTFVCVDGDVHVCELQGTATSLSRECPEASPCLAYGPTVADCVPRACEPGMAGCVANQLGTCAADGRSLSQVAQDCASVEQVCSSASACSESATDVVGVAEEVEYFPADYVLGNVIDVHSSRQLTKLETHLLLDAPRDLRFVVFEQSDQAYELACFEITAGNVGSGFFGSSTLSCPLEAGKRYLLGVVILVGEGHHYYDEAPWSASLSFAGVAAGSFNGYGVTTYFDTFGPVYRQRVTTELP
jgi:hypothetical protein